MHNIELSCLAAVLVTACAPGPSSTGDSANPAPTDTAQPVQRASLQFRFPIDEAQLISGGALGVDHDPQVYEGIYRLTCTNFAGAGFPYCYDEHDGSDFLLDGGFDTMDSGSATVLAAEAGVVLSTEDGHYDRCHGDLSTMDVSCDGYEMVANHVILEHDTGHQTLYWHLKNGSVSVKEGQMVQQGDPLGKVGSSGYSTAPHLHFELHDSTGMVIDPYAGPYSQDETWWCDQPDDLDDLPGLCQED